MTLEIDWSEINPKYQWAARDRGGRVYVYVNRPSHEDYAWSYEFGKFECVRIDEPDLNWRDTLTQRLPREGVTLPLAHQEINARSHEVPFGQLERHVQLALFNAWLDGAQIECQDDWGWTPLPHPSWLRSHCYRIALPPAPKTKPSID